MTEKLHGEEGLMNWLLGNGFKLEREAAIGSLNECNWYAWRRSELPARKCEINDGEGMVIVVTAYKARVGSVGFRSVSISVTGVFDGTSREIEAYGIEPESVPAKLADVESSLISAWNALNTPTNTL